MTGVDLLKIGALAAATSGGGGGTPPAPVSTADCYGTGVCYTGGEILSGTAYNIFETDLSGGGTLYCSINGGAFFACAGSPTQHLFQGGQKLNWMIQNGTDATVSGTCTITDITTSTVIATFSYSVLPS